MSTKSIDTDPTMAKQKKSCLSFGFFVRIVDYVKQKVSVQGNTGSVWKITIDKEVGKVVTLAERTKQT